MLTHPTFGYCTNVHAGITLEQAKANLLKYAGRVREAIGAEKLPVGLWLAEEAAQELATNNAAEDFAAWLGEHGFLPYTLNGFPQGNFHQDVVKLDVYRPTWAEKSRREYTSRLISILDTLLPEGHTGSISTLPLGWPDASWRAGGLDAAAHNLLAIAEQLASLFDETGREIVLAIEPEPGCQLNTAEEVVAFFERYIFAGSGTAARRHLGVCHDVCHSGVMFESQTGALEAYRNAGIRIGKVQVSSAVHVPWDQAATHDAKQQILEQLRQFDEPKYMHQTSRGWGNELEELASDLPAALADWTPEGSLPLPDQPWRVHFHVPIFVHDFGSLQTTASQIGEVVDYLATNGQTALDSYPWFLGHYEVETYAWPVLPKELQVNDLADGISKELIAFEAIRQSSISDERT